ncbi:MAG: M3 family oligoendopeptidase [Gemmatimonadetes bacterium]|nr:M3 family oligoendopeptidase [Gemmatimonadota bacterium]
MRFTAPADFAAASWDEIAAAYDCLLAQPVDHGTVAGWLAEWSRLESNLSEAASLAMIAYTCDTADSAKEASYRRFAVEIGPRAEEKSVALARRLCAVGYAPPDLAPAVARFRRAIEVFREENVPLTAQLEETIAEYQRLTGGFEVEFEGRRLPIPQLAPFLQSPDRARREAAFRAGVGPYLGQRETMARLFDRQLELRRQVARNAGYADFRDYSFAAKCRFDYTPGDCERFQAAVEAVAVPAVARLRRARAATLGVTELRPWDLAVSLHRREPLRPFSDGADLTRRAQAVFDRLDPVLAAQFRDMAGRGLLDLDSRPGKAPGGYCDTLHSRGAAFIFMNASGVMEDVETLLHEAGHAFHAFASHRQPLIWQRHPSSESAELASMSMELLAAPLLDGPGAFLSSRDAAIARLEHLEDVLVTLCHVASVDAFQHWIYTDPAGCDARARDQAWLSIRARFEPIVDWGGLEAERIARWYRQLHIFLYPFYYIEYGIAQLGALQIWRRHRRDPGDALARYRDFLALGATRSLPELYRVAGASLVFDAGSMAELVAEVEAEIESLRAQIGREGLA